jgi:K+-sensing histidine kinase KdpD
MMLRPARPRQPLRARAVGPTFAPQPAEEGGLTLARTIADPVRIEDHPLAGYLAGLAMVAVATFIALATESQARPPNLSLVFVLPVVIAAVNWGWGPAILTTVTGILADNFFLIEPRYTLRVSDPANVWSLVLLGGAAAIVSAVAAESHRRAQTAERQSEQYEALQRLARSLVGAAGQVQILRAAEEALSGVFRVPVTVLVEDAGDLRPVGGARRLQPGDIDAAKWALASRLAVRGGVYPAEDSQFDFWPLVTPSRLQAVIGVDWSGRERPAEPERLVEIIGGYLAVALERDAFAASALRARLIEEGERVKADLLAAVSHDLRTPLSSILFTLQSLRAFGEAHDPATREQLLASAETETARLAGLVGNLLDMNRVDAGALRAEPRPMSIAEIVEPVLQRLRTALTAHAVHTALPADLPPVLADPALAEGALANVLENAAKYAPAGSVIELTAQVIGGELALDVLDQGPGFTGPAEPLFEKFARGVAGDGRPPGTGLGLAIARGYLAAQGGRIEAQNRSGESGARIRLILPLAREPA